jgi:tetratricopeptide (TPR) repeat protein
MRSLAEAYLLAGRIDDAADAGQQALVLARERRQRIFEAAALAMLGDICARRPLEAPDDAEAHYRQALALAEPAGLRPLAARIHLGLGTLYARAGRSEVAHEELGIAATMFRDMDMPLWLTRADRELASL